MSDTVLKVENLSKVYRLGEIGTGTISHDLNRWWARLRGKEDPFAKIGSVNDRTQKAQKGEYVKVLDNISFDVKRGEVLGIIGRNGAGKSTLLKVISQITSPTTGAIKAKGRIASLLEVGTGMHPEMTGRENVYLNGTILGMTRREIDAKFDEIMDFAGCAKYADTPIKRYSSGMKVRLGFAVAAFLEPEILIVDEVLAVGDAEFQKKAIGKMQDITAGGGRTVLFVSHNMGAVRSLCKSGILLEKGQIVENASIERVISSYLNSDISKAEVYLRHNQYKDIYIKSISIQNAKGEISASVDVRYSFNIVFGVVLHQIPSGLEIGFSIFNERGVKVFYAGEKIENLIRSKNEKQEIKVESVIPEKFLMPGKYYINSALHVPNIEAYDNHDRVVSFTMEETGGEHFMYSGRDMGVVFAKLKWEAANL